MRHRAIATIPLATAALLVATVLIATPAHAAWALDPSFGNQGAATTSFSGGIDIAYDVAVYPENGPNAGKIVAVGQAPDKGSGSRGGSDFAVSRYNADGTLDSTFGTGGLVTNDFGEFTFSDLATAVAVYPANSPDAGKIVVGGNYNPPDDNIPRFGVMRFDSSGAPDKTFGKVVVTFADGVGQFARLSDLAIQPDGKIVLGGTSKAQGGADDSDFAVARLLPTGKLDTSFDTDGKVRTDADASSDSPKSQEDVSTDLLLQPDGKIVLGGYANDGHEGPIEMALVRYNPDGSLDASFGSKGIASNELAPECPPGPNGIPTPNIFGRSMALLPSGEIIVAGMASCFSHGTDFLLVRFKADGKQDLGFGPDGYVTSNFTDTDSPAVVLLQADKLLLVGTTSLNGNDAFALARFGLDGKPDKTFGSNDYRITTSIGLGDDLAFGAALQSDGRILVAGSTFIGGSDYDFAVARFDGSDDAPPPSDKLTANFDELPEFQVARSFPVGWSSSGATGDVDYDVRVKAARYFENALSAPTVLLTRTTGTSGNAQVKPGQGETICYQARAHSGNEISPWSKDACTGVPLDDKALGAQGKWQRAKGSSFFDATVSKSTDKGAELFIGDIFFKQLALVVTECAGCGVVGVFVDGKKVKEINLDSVELLVKQVFPVVSFPKAGKHDVDMRVLNPGSKGVWIDGLGVRLK